MIRADKSLTCRECGKSFLFTAGEQEFFANRGFTNEPTRCPQCRALRRQSRDSGGGSGYSNAASGALHDRPRRELHTVPCARCGLDAQVPFVPKGDRPVYCSDCFDAERSGSSGGNRGGGRGRGW